MSNYGGSEVSEDLNAIVFPGQGAQFRGMGRGIFEEFGELVQLADRVLGYSIATLCLEDKHRQLNDTRYTQPALYVVNILCYLKAMKEGAAKPDFLAGHSLGEYCALFAAGAYDFETGLRLVQRRGELMSHASGGGMAAIQNLPSATVKALLQEHSRGGVEVANLNSPSQTVLAGPVDELRAFAPAVQRAGGLVMELPVNAAFHSRYMQSAMEEFRNVVQSFRLDDPAIPVISNLHARPYRSGEIKENLVGQIRNPVRWVESIWFLLAKAVRIQEIGAKRTLTRLIEQIAAHGVSPLAEACQGA